jgi:propanol-preferring alcohol dehydrogenase
MRAVVLTRPGPIAQAGLELRDVPVPEPGPGEVLLRVHANAICRTDLHVIEGELPDPKLPLIPGHQIAGVVEALGPGTQGVANGDRVGVPWLGGTDGNCPYCRSGRENLCDRPTFTGYQRDGGYAEYATARADFLLPLPAGYSDLHVAPLLCAGLIGFRSLRLAEVDGLGRPGRLGMYGFGSSAHIIIQAAIHLGHEVYVYTRGETGRRLALELGAAWAGAGEVPPVELDSVIVFAPAGPLVPLALRAVRKGGLVVCAGIHMSPIPAFDYDLLWGERVLRSVANLTRADGHDFLALAPQVPVKTEVEVYPLERAREALQRMKAGEVVGTAVLAPSVTRTGPLPASG